MHPTAKPAGWFSRRHQTGDVHVRNVALRAERLAAKMRRAKEQNARAIPRIPGRNLVDEIVPRHPGTAALVNQYGDIPGVRIRVRKQPIGFRVVVTAPHRKAA